MNPQAGRIYEGEFLGDSLEKSLRSFVSQDLGRFSRRIRQRPQAKSTEKSAKSLPKSPPKNPLRKSARKSAKKIRKENPAENPPKHPPESSPQDPPQNPPWKHLASSSCDRLSVAFGLCHLSGLFWMFKRHQISPYRSKLHSKIRQKIRPDKLQSFFGVSKLEFNSPYSCRLELELQLCLVAARCACQFGFTITSLILQSSELQITLPLALPAFLQELKCNHLWQHARTEEPTDMLLRSEHGGGLFHALRQRCPGHLGLQSGRPATGVLDVKFLEVLWRVLPRVLWEIGVLRKVLLRVLREIRGASGSVAEGALPVGG